MTIQSIDRVARTVQVVQLVDMPFELVDDDEATLPELPDTSLLQEKYAPAYILPVIDGAGGSNSQTVPFKLNLNTDSSAALDNELNAPGALESDANRADDYWVAYVLAAYQGRSFSPLINRGDNDPDSENRLQGITMLEGRGSFVFIETIRDANVELGREEGAPTVAHELAHQFGIKDCGGLGQRPCEFLDLMGPEFYKSGSRFVDLDLDQLRSRVKSPGRRQ